MAILEKIEQLVEAVRRHNLPDAPPWIAGPQLTMPVEFQTKIPTTSHVSGQLRELAFGDSFTEPIRTIFMEVAELLDDSHQWWLEQIVATLGIELDDSFQINCVGTPTGRWRSITPLEANTSKKGSDES